MRKSVTSELILRQAEELQHLPVSEQRAIELAREVESINAEVFEAALQLEFDDEPAAFARTLRARRPGGESGE